MAEPVTPVYPHAKLKAEFNIDMEESDREGLGATVIPLPVIRVKIHDGEVYSFLSRWRLSDKEREEVARTGDLYIACVGGQVPIMVYGCAPKLEGETLWFHEEDLIEKLFNKPSE